MGYLSRLLVFLCFFTSNSDCQDATKPYDAVYVINLDRSPERLQKMSKQLNNIGIKFKRFSAIDGNKLKIVNVRTGKIEDLKSFSLDKKFEDNVEYVISHGTSSFRYKTNRKSCERYLSYGELGCAISHLCVMRDIVKNKFKKTVVLEDDIILEKNFKNDLMLSIVNTPYDFDIMFLDVGMNEFSVDLERPINESVFIANPARIFQNITKIPDNKYVATISEKNHLWGTYAYCISLEGARKIIESYDPITEPIDEHLFHAPKMNSSKTTLYVARKKMLYISDEPSLICDMGRNFASTKDAFYRKNNAKK